MWLSLPPVRRAVTITRPGHHLLGQMRRTALLHEGFSVVFRIELS
jgi:hypothetical protein